MPQYVIGYVPLSIRVYARYLLTHICKHIIILSKFSAKVNNNQKTLFKGDNLNLFYFLLRKYLKHDMCFGRFSTKPPLIENEVDCTIYGEFNLNSVACITALHMVHDSCEHNKCFNFSKIKANIMRSSVCDLDET